MGIRKMDRKPDLTNEEIQDRGNFDGMERLGEGKVREKKEEEEIINKEEG